MIDDTVEGATFPPAGVPAAQRSRGSVAAEGQGVTAARARRLSLPQETDAIQILNHNDVISPAGDSAERSAMNIYSQGEPSNLEFATADDGELQVAATTTTYAGQPDDIEDHDMDDALMAGSVPRGKEDNQNQ